MLDKILDELIDGKKTYSVAGVAGFSNLFSFFHCPASITEWTELFNLIAAFVAVILVSWRLVDKILRKNTKE